MRFLLVAAIGLSPAAAAAAAPCTPTSEDYKALLSAPFVVTPASFKTLSVMQQQDLCRSRALLQMVRLADPKALDRLTAEDIPRELSRFLTGAEYVEVRNVAWDVLEKGRKAIERPQDLKMPCSLDESDLAALAKSPLRLTADVLPDIEGKVKANVCKARVLLKRIRSAPDKEALVDQLSTADIPVRLSRVITKEEYAEVKTVVIRVMARAFSRRPQRSK